MNKTDIKPEDTLTYLLELDLATTVKDLKVFDSVEGKEIKVGSPPYPVQLVSEGVTPDGTCHVLNPWVHAMAESPATKMFYNRLKAAIGSRLTMTVIDIVRTALDENERIAKAATNKKAKKKDGDDAVTIVQSCAGIVGDIINDGLDDKMLKELHNLYIADPTFLFRPGYTAKTLTGFVRCPLLNDELPDTVTVRKNTVKVIAKVVKHLYGVKKPEDMIEKYSVIVGNEVKTNSKFFALVHTLYGVLQVVNKFFDILGDSDDDKIDMDEFKSHVDMLEHHHRTVVTLIPVMPGVQKAGAEFVDKPASGPRLVGSHNDEPVTRSLIGSTGGKSSDMVGGRTESGMTLLGSHSPKMDKAEQRIGLRIVGEPTSTDESALTISERLQRRRMEKERANGSSHFGSGRSSLQPQRSSSLSMNNRQSNLTGNLGRRGSLSLSRNPGRL